jgi:undecaprenyl-diphosphatase
MSYPPYFNSLRVALCVVASLWCILKIADAQATTETADLEHQILASMRDADNPSRMIGPRFAEEAMRDFTALGGYAVLTMMTLGFGFFAAAELGHRTFHFFWLTIVGGFLTSLLAKYIVQRERPSIVPHLSHVSGNTSFPSAHAMMSVVVFVTIGFLLAQQTSNRHLQRLFVGLPLGISAIVGVSRVCMGVHFPSDVLGGWAGGLIWIWLAFRLRGATRQTDAK